ncbi:tetratricopeptide repeat protein [Defluviimonas sp. WL0002]|uniref:Tetratricopeptide repeat protein n=1 Tax=Albidovulum marisflavi TaxID=2984159 RepID=A0ABT2ZBC6_9RHOB|nr:tetratricopeptide repeat protein [Defluviimonas sp. WL0002]MCV2868386.1 tetratricopeptide repeat protein [Defluviimonas sp. WL0002]
MRNLFRYLKPVAAVIAIHMMAVGAAMAQDADLDRLYAELADPENENWQRTQADILREWSRSGSPSMDLLLQRGQDAIESGDFQGAIEHLTALVDQAPDFAEGWNARATAYFHAGYLGPSIVDIQHTLALNPHHFGALAGLGMIMQASGKPEAALRAFTASLAIHPHQDALRHAVDELERESLGTRL